MTVAADWTTVCQCEHTRHFPDIPSEKVYWPGHKYLDVPSGEQRAIFVGPICDDCATYCLPDWIINPTAENV